MNRSLFPGRYDFSCGEHVISGEDYYSAALRGVKEELGLEDIHLVEVGKIGCKEGASSFMKVYKAVYDGKIKCYDKDGISEIKYYSLDKIFDMMKKDINTFKPDFKVVLNWYLNK
ncbi:NUDIX domain protein [Candidatus Tiddalikarchaeum anstoanum]|nr:NUDIX domain protein [Candidatus Tiddalikarchaeum anstoanum]